MPEPAKLNEIDNLLGHSAGDLLNKHPLPPGPRRRFAARCQGVAVGDHKANECNSVGRAQPKFCKTAAGNGSNWSEQRSSGFGRASRKQSLLDPSTQGPRSGSASNLGFLTDSSQVARRNWCRISGDRPRLRSRLRIHIRHAQHTFTRSEGSQSNYSATNFDVFEQRRAKSCCAVCAPRECIRKPVLFADFSDLR